MTRKAKPVGDVAESRKPPFFEPEQEAPGRESWMRVKPDYGRETYRGNERLRDKVAVITGGDSGIGRATALAFAREGAKVAFSYFNENEDANETVEAIEESGGKVISVAGDLVQPGRQILLIEETLRAFGRLDVLVNNAAYSGEEVDSFDKLEDERIALTFRVNVFVPFSLIRLALPHMERGASIINTASVQAFDPSPGLLDYAATKGAIVTMSKGLSRELIKRGIRVNCVAPGPVWTPLIPHVMHDEQLENFGRESGLNRPAQPAELAPTYVFLASDESAYVNGAVIQVAGGP